MNIAVVTHENPYDRRSWSGTLFHMFTALQHSCGNVISLGPACETLYFASKAFRKGILRPLGLNIDPSHTFFLSKRLASAFRNKLLGRSFDAIFAPAARVSLGFLDTQIPIIYYTDLTARQFRDYAQNLQGLWDRSIEQTEELERRAFAKARHIVVPSEWAAKSTVQDYGVCPERVSVIRMGANIQDVPSRERVISLRAKGSSRDCQLLFVAVDWERKGGEIALGAMSELLNRGIKTTLTVVGCSPPRASIHSNMRIVPFLKKSVPEERRKFNDLLLHSDFMLFPTRRDASPIVCAEANAFGLPLITSNVGGLAVRDGENGILLPPDASPGQYADAIQQLIENPSRYTELAESGRDVYDAELNWEAWGRSMATLFQRYCYPKTDQPIGCELR